MIKESAISEKLSKFNKGRWGILYTDIANWSKSTGYNVYIVGGAIRDALQPDKTFKDIDFCVESPNPYELVDYLAGIKDEKGSLPKYKIISRTDFTHIGTSKISLSFPRSSKDSSLYQIQFEIAMTRKEIYEGSVRQPSKVLFTDVKEDALRRDFCCNAVYYNIVTNKLIDPTGKGLHDIKTKTLRSMKDPSISFKEDPLRMIRCLRFSLSLGFGIEQKTMNAITWNPEYESLSLDLIRPDFQISLYQGGSKFIRTLHEKGLLKHIIPELEESWGFNQNSPYHSMNLTDHLLATLDWALGHASNSFNEYFRTILAFSALLHDISKYKCFQLKENNYFSFHDHENTSSEMAKEILRRMGYGKSFVASVTGIIRCHMLLKPWWDPRTKQPTGTRKQWRKTYDKLNNLLGLDNTLVAIALIDADNNTHAPEHCRPGQAYKFLNVVSTKFPNPYDPRYDIPNNEEVISLLGLDPKNPKSGKIAAKVRKAMEDIVPLQFDSTKLTKDEIFGIYLGIFDNVMYVHKNLQPYGEVNFYVSLASAPSSDERFAIKVIEPDYIAEFSKYFEKNSDADNLMLEVESKYYPDLLMRYRVNQDVNRIINEISKKIQELKELPGYSRLVISEEGGDLGSVIEFTNRDRIVIV